jgi:hypothetical protein
VVFTKQFKALAGWRLALMNEGINALFSTCQQVAACGVSRVLLGCYRHFPKFARRQPVYISLLG